MFLSIPCFYFIVLFSRRRRLDPGYWAEKESGTVMTEKEAIAIRDEDPKNSKLSFLVEMYRPTYWWWEVRASHKIPMRLGKEPVGMFDGLLGTVRSWRPSDDLRSLEPCRFSRLGASYSCSLACGYVS